MPLKPNVLEEYAKERAILPVPPKDSYVSDKDCVFLEDETGRTKLRGIAFQAKDLITGMIVAVKGRGVEDGDFEVHEIIEPGIAPQRPLKNTKTGNQIALVSGLHIGQTSSNPLPVQLLAEYITGNVGSPLEHQFQSTIVRLILAGNSLFTENEERINDQSLRFNKKQQSHVTQHVHALDRYLLSLCSSLQVDIMPGASDPANITLPQQPLNRCLFRKASSLPTLHRVTNPHAFEVEGVSFLGHSGQMLDNMEKYMDVESRMDLICKMLKWRQLAPNCPDLLYGFPNSSDPFILNEAPHVIFFGNQPAFETKLIEGPEGQEIRVVLLPTFSQNPTFALINIDNLDCTPVSFQLYDEHTN
uniref:DNA polymerase alpha/delta/epsilon subunit B domain-containing protein n=1 Tax=Arcella intermedia TaxID=1963864 RepID=A0A6B2L460_9EUKA